MAAGSVVVDVVPASEEAGSVVPSPAQPRVADLAPVALVVAASAQGVALAWVEQIQESCLAFLEARFAEIVDPAPWGAAEAHLPSLLPLDVGSLEEKVGSATR